MKLVFPALACLALVAGCVTPEPPAVANYNGASVTIQEAGLFSSTPPSAAAVAEAQRICGTARKKAQYASATMATEYRVNYLFLCL